MFLSFRTFIPGLLCLASFQAASGQPTTDTVKSTADAIKLTSDTAKEAETFTYADDTIYSSKGYKIFVGQHVIAGKGSGEEGRYKYISFKSPFAFPLIFLRNTEIRQDIDYRNDPNLRDQDKVKEALVPGSTLTIRKIKVMAKHKKWQYYRVHLWDGSSSLSNKYQCDIISALNAHEVSITPK